MYICVLYNIHCIISHISNNKCNHWQWFYLFSLVLKESNTNISPGTEAIIY